MKGCLRLRLRTIGVVGDESDYVVGQNLRLARLFGPLTKNYWCEDILKGRELLVNNIVRTFQNSDQSPNLNHSIVLVTSST